MDAPKIEFPCAYPIKVILDNDLTAIAEVEAIARRYDPKLQDQIEVRPSKKGAYVSLRLSFWATSLSQIEALFAELKQLSAVRMVL
ncbi:MAG: putative lipoic acid-binding regulatory protein [Candidatus Azotimanducaceae bacterium]|jgi:putative lipoic acid-binding regulatory protein